MQKNIKYYKNYKRKIAIKISTVITAKEDQKTNLVKLDQVFFCSLISIDIYPCLAFIRGFFLLITYNFPRLLTNLLFRSLFFKDFKELTTFIIFFLKPGNDLLSHTLRQSTIGAEELDFRVRNGIGYDLFAIITRQNLILTTSD